MAGDWAYDELLEIAAVELMILGLSLRCTLIVAVIACFRRYAVAHKDHFQLVRPLRRATRFLIENYLSYVALGQLATSAPF